MALLELVEQQADGDLVREMLAFAADRIMEFDRVMTGIGPVPVQVPRVRGRRAGEDKISFTPSILPRYLPAQDEIYRGSVALALPQGCRHGPKTIEEDLWFLPGAPETKPDHLAPLPP